MVMAVLGDLGMVKCSMGASPFPITALKAIGVLINGKVPSTIEDLPPAPNFGTCVVWTSKTQGVSPACVPSIVPDFKPGSPTGKWCDIPANIDSDMGNCSEGGQIIVAVPGSTIVFG